MACYLLFVICYSLFVIRYLLFVIRYLLFVDRVLIALQSAAYCSRSRPVLSGIFCVSSVVNVLIDCAGATIEKPASVFLTGGPSLKNVSSEDVTVLSCWISSGMPVTATNTGSVPELVINRL